MSREIKFRAWDGKKMAYDVGVFNNQNVCDHEDEAVWFWHEPPEAIMQFTGLKDKNGKEIYEGDIVIVYEYLNGEPWNLHNAVVEWGSGMFIINPAYCHQDINNTLEVIGNIYEHPTLLTTTQEK